jgi:ubiquinone/menaquinone biosynthesis C-methylase UbiE
VSYDEIGGWKASAQAWIDSQAEAGDYSRRAILDPALETILGDVAGLAVLDVGCGEGRYSRHLARKGASVTGIDPVDTFIERARSLHPEGTYLVSGGEALTLPDRSSDLILSYLSLIDIPDYRAAIREMARVVKADGRIVLVTISNVASTTDRWIKDEQGRKLYRAVDRYMEEFALDLEWSNIRVRNYHRSLSAILQPFLEQGLVVDGFYEPLPDPDDAGYANEHRVPSFQIVTFRYPGG